MSFEFDSEEERRRAEAGIVRLRVGLALVDDARRGGGFETDEAKLATRVEEILAALSAAGANPAGTIVTATPEDSERVHLSALTSEHGSDDCLLRSDGVLLEQYATITLSAAAAGTEELSPEQEESMRRAQAEYEAMISRPHFEGKRFLRALTLDPQPGAEIQLLAVELFDDGLVVHYSFDTSQEELEASMHHEDERRPGLRVADDHGTEYHRWSGGGSNPYVARSAIEFAPAVPEAARALLITTHSGTVELQL